MKKDKLPQISEENDSQIVEEEDIDFEMWLKYHAELEEYYEKLSKEKNIVVEWG